MGKRFMIVKPSLCCGNKDSIGSVHTEDKSVIIYPISECNCGHEEETYANGPVVSFRYKGEDMVIDEQRIIWLPDELDVINHDMKLDIPLKV
jgi:hypothetical protein